MVSKLVFSYRGWFFILPVPDFWGLGHVAGALTCGKKKSLSTSAFSISQETRSPVSVWGGPAVFLVFLLLAIISLSTYRSLSCCPWYPWPNVILTGLSLAFLSVCFQCFIYSHVKNDSESICNDKVPHLPSALANYCNLLWTLPSILPCFAIWEQDTMFLDWSNLHIVSRLSLFGQVLLLQPMITELFFWRRKLFRRSWLSCFNSVPMCFLWCCGCDLHACSQNEWLNT